MKTMIDYTAIAENHTNEELFTIWEGLPNYHREAIEYLQLSEQEFIELLEKNDEIEFLDLTVEARFAQSEANNHEKDLEREFIASRL